MSVHALVEPTPELRVPAAPRRRCPCGGAPGPTGECDRCRARRLARERAAAETRISPGAARGHDMARIRAHADTARPAVAPTAPVNEFEDCPVDWQRKANAALVTARSWVSNVINGLTTLPTPIPPRVSALLLRHFHTTYSGDIARIVSVYRTIASALAAPIEFECETSCDANVAAYVYSVWSDVHLCPVWYRLGHDDRADTIIHEIAHDAANRDDEAYDWEPKYATLSVDDAIDNADSYSTFAKEASRP